MIRKHRVPTCAFIKAHIASSSSHVAPPARFANNNNYTPRRFRTCIYDNNLRSALVKQKNKTDAHTTINNYIVSIISILNLALYIIVRRVCVFVYRGQTSVNSHRTVAESVYATLLSVPCIAYIIILYNMYTFSIIRI